MSKDIIIKLNVTKMEDYLNTFWEKNRIGTCPTDKVNYFNTMSRVFEILKDFEVKDEKADS